MTSKRARARAKYRNTLFVSLSELESGDAETVTETARRLVLALEEEYAPARQLSNKDYLVMFQSLGRIQDLTLDALRKVAEARRPARKPKQGRAVKDVKKSILQSKRIKHSKTQAPTKRRPPMARVDATVPFQKILDENWKACLREGKSMPRPKAEDVLETIERNLGNKPFTYPLILRSARRLHKGGIILTPMAIANHVIKVLSRRGNLKVTLISTATRR